MKGQTSRGRRIYSLEPNKIVGATFVRKYVNHFMPALLKIINEKRISDDENDGDCICEVYKKVRYEADMALVMSTQELFAWSHALKLNLLQTNLNVGKLQSSLSLHNLISSKCSGDNLPSSHEAIFSMKIPPYPKIFTNNLRRPKKAIMPPRKKREAEKESKDEMLISSRLKNFRSLLPGGGEMGTDKLLSEVGSYIVCLELQVNVLKCLIDMN
ncbi:hypothetical protein Dsin_008338 [Dipteronia sinensis]|uniref:IBH1-like N-terminal domain-containing protein n=1 Tax=Dipteronia sinensis TaxID=43782 RepID=A0AAE0ANZ4_9ROSI|nr:hypothetical protein Dsin_008338 [Dipteronia sinensis]